MGIDKSWRKKAINMLKGKEIKNILDIATGTGDFAIEASRLPEVQITGIDISDKMLAVGQNKIKKKNLEKRIRLFNGDSESLLFADNSFDAVTVAFGVRNFENLDVGLSEMCRVLKPGCLAIILEFSKPRKFPFKQLYFFYFNHILPVLGKLFSYDDSAYNYLPESVSHFPDGDDFLVEMRNAGFQECSVKILTFGIAAIYSGKKK